MTPWPPVIETAGGFGGHGEAELLTAPPGVAQLRLPDFVLGADPFEVDVFWGCFGVGERRPSLPDEGPLELRIGLAEVEGVIGPGEVPLNEGPDLPNACRCAEIDVEAARVRGEGRPGPFTRWRRADRDRMGQEARVRP